MAHSAKTLRSWYASTLSHQGNFSDNWIQLTDWLAHVPAEGKPTLIPFDIGNDPINSHPEEFPSHEYESI
jgi:hypothetical protein